MTSRTRAWVCALLLAVGLAFRLALAIGMPNDEPDDARVYSLLARNVLLHGAYSGAETPPFAPTYMRVPGYPLFVAGIYRVFGVGNDTAVRVAQAVVDTVTCWMIACLALALAPAAWPPERRRRVQCAALGLAAVCPFTAIYVTTVLTEVWALASGTAVAWLAIRALQMDNHDEPGEADRPRQTWVWWLAAGLAGGVLAMVRPEGGLLTAGVGVTMVLAAVWVWRRHPRSWSRVASRVVWSGVPLALGFLVCTGPWIVRNALVFGIFQPTASAQAVNPGEFAARGYFRWLKTWVAEPKYVEPFEFNLDSARLSIDQVPSRAFDSPQEHQLVAELFSRYNDGDSGARLSGRPTASAPAGLTPDLDARFETLAEGRIRRHPLRYYVLLPAERVVWLWADTHSQYYPFSGELLPLGDLDRDRHQQVWLPIFALLTLAWTAFGAAGVVRLLPEPGSRIGLALLAMLVGPRLVLLGSIGNPEPRYVVGLFPFLSALGGIAIASSGLAVRGLTRALNGPVVT